MNIAMLDVLLMLPMLFGAVVGYRKGIVLELARTLGLILAIALGILLLDYGVLLLTPYFEKSYQLLLPFISFLLIFIIIYSTSGIVGKKVRQVLRFSLFGSFDKIAGAALGLSKMAFLFATLIWAINTIGITIPKDYSNDTFIYPVISELGPKAMRLFSSVSPYLKEGFEMLQQQLEKKS